MVVKMPHGTPGAWVCYICCGIFEHATTTHVAQPTARLPQVTQDGISQQPVLRSRLDQEVTGFLEQGVGRVRAGVEIECSKDTLEVEVCWCDGRGLEVDRNGIPAVPDGVVRPGIGVREYDGYVTHRGKHSAQDLTDAIVQRLPEGAVMQKPIQELPGG